VAGGLLGLWQGMLAAPLDSSPHLGDALIEVLKPVAVGVAVGVTAGGLAATVVCTMVPWLRDEQALPREDRVVRGRDLPVGAAIEHVDLAELDERAVAITD
jgi:hypothetical protein